GIRILARIQAGERWSFKASWGLVIVAPSEPVSAESSEERGTDSGTGEITGSSAAWDSIGGSLGGASASVEPEVAGSRLVSAATPEAATASAVFFRSACR